MSTLYDNFKNPPDEYTPIPFWFWNDQLDKSEISRQINDFYDKGVMGFVIHPRIGMPKNIEYLSDEFMDYVSFAVQQADRLGMKVVLYDEGMYPSGSAHGMVVQSNPRYASKGLKVLELPYDELNLDSDITGNIISVQAARKIDNVILEDTIMVLEIDDIKFHVPDSDWYIYIFTEVFTKGTIRGIHLDEDDGCVNAPKSADLLDEDAMGTFITLTHQRYYDALKLYFGTTVIGMFTDEPCILGRCVDENIIPWTTRFLSYYKKNGNDERNLLSLFYETDDDYIATRKRYNQAVNKKLESSYYEPLAKWCHEHGISLTGHPEKSNDIGVLKHFDIPGQDVVWRWVAPEDGKALIGEHSTMAKCSSDSARHYGKTRNANECFGCCGPNGVHWKFTADDMKWYLDWLFVRGVNLVYPHAFYYSVEGEERYGERPPDVGPSNIWWKYYTDISDYIKRMCYLLTNSVNQAKVAVLCEEDYLPWKIVKPLYEHQIEFNYLEESLLLSDRCKVGNGAIVIEKQQYNTLVIEDERLNQGEVKLAVDRFIECGGRVVLFSQKDIINPNIIVIDNYEYIVDVVKDIAGDISLVPHNKDLRTTHVIKDNTHFYVLVNEGQHVIDGDVFIPHDGCIQIWNTWTGDKRHVSKSHNKSIRIKLERRESVVICVGENDDTIYNFDEEKLSATEVVLKLDGIWELSCNNVKPIMKDKLCSWHEINELYLYCGTVKYFKTFSFHSFNKDAIYKLELGEVHEIAHAYLNGKDLGVRMWGPYVYELTDALVEGENHIEIHVTNSRAVLYEKEEFASGIIGNVVVVKVV